MPEAPLPLDAPRRHGNEYQDNHYHDDEEVEQPPADDDAPPKVRLPVRPQTRRLPPPPLATDPTTLSDPTTMRVNTVKQALRSGQPSVGTWLSLGSVTAARFLARVGFA